MAILVDGNSIVFLFICSRFFFALCCPLVMLLCALTVAVVVIKVMTIPNQCLLMGDSMPVSSAERVHPMLLRITRVNREVAPSASQRQLYQLNAMETLEAEAAGALARLRQREPGLLM